MAASAVSQGIGYATIAIDVIIKVYKRIKQVKKNEERRVQILSYLEELDQNVRRLTDLEDDIPEFCSAKVKSFLDFIVKSEGICDTIRGITKMEQLENFVFHANDHKTELNELETNISNARDLLQLVLTEALLVQNIKLQKKIDVLNSQNKTLQEKLDDLTTLVIYQHHGVYVPNSKGATDVPLQIKKPQVVVKFGAAGGRMIITWIDDINQGTVETYKVSINEIPVSKPPEECRFLEGSNVFRMTLVEPTIKLGVMYKIKVCGTNGAGEGMWSESTECEYKVCAPNKPEKPTATIVRCYPMESHFVHYGFPYSPTGQVVVLAIRRPPIEDGNGSPITSYEVRYKSASEHRERKIIDEFPVSTKRRQLIEHRICFNYLSSGPHSFRIRVKNDVSWSVFSDTLQYTVPKP